jgi:exodeoxyribonuclease VII small subunit
MAKQPAKDSLTFEDAVSRLDEIVSQMESAELPLDGIIEKYEEGMNLLAFCGEKLQAAEKKIELLTHDKSGKLHRSELAATGGSEPPVTKKDKGGADSEVSLF